MGKLFKPPCHFYLENLLILINAKWVVIKDEIFKDEILNMKFKDDDSVHQWVQNVNVLCRSG